MPNIVIAPILVPFLAGVLLLALRDLPMPLRRWLAMFSVLAQIGSAIALLVAVSGGDILVYRLGDWPAPWGIVLVADRLAAWMVLITALLALFAAIHAGDGTDRQGRHFHVLFQMQLFGLAGAFLTGDLFNLFVFFEILLIASYGLLLHGGGPARTRAGLHYVVLNLLGSTVFLFAAGLIYASLGSLNLADLAAKAATVAPENLGLARVGGLLLLAVFALKAALLPLALATLAIGMLGALAATSLGRLAAYLVVASVGTLLIAFALGSPAAIAAGLYYLPHSTFTAALLFLLAEAVRRRRPASADFFTPDADMSRHALWGGLFFVAAIAAAGLPPLSGFVGKFLILRAASGHSWVWAAMLISALAILIALARAGSRLFFSIKSVEAVGTTAAPVLIDAQPDEPPDPPSGRRESIAILGLLGLVLAISLLANTICLTPGTVSARLSADRRQLLVHALDCADPAALVATIKTRFEAPLKEILEC